MGWLDGSEGKSTFHVRLDNLSHHGGRREQTVRSCPLTHIRVPTDIKTQVILIFNVCGCLGSGMCRCHRSPEEGLQSGCSSGKTRNGETPGRSSSTDVPQNGTQSNSMRPGCWGPNLCALLTTELSLRPPKNKILLEDETCGREPNMNEHRRHYAKRNKPGGGDKSGRGVYSIRSLSQEVQWRLPGLGVRCWGMSPCRRKWLQF